MADAWQAALAPLEQPFVRHALAEVALLGVVGGVLGAWIVLYGISYSAESLAHGLFPGLVIASLLGLPLLLGGAVGVACAALSIGLASTLRGSDRDTSVGVIVTSMFGLGVLLALRPTSPPGLGALLFGDVLAVTTRDVAVTALAAACILALLAALHGRLLVVGFDRAAARALGVRPQAVELALLLAVAAAVVIALTALGSLLVVALLVAPAVAGRILARRVRTIMLVAVAVGVAGGIGGIYLSWYASIAAGAAIALVLVGLALCAVLADSAAGALRRGTA